MSNSVQITVSIELQRVPGDERIARLVEAVTSIYPEAVDVLPSAEPSGEQAAETSEVQPWSPELVPARLAADRLRSRAFPDRRVHPQTVRRCILRGELLAVTGPKGKLVPLEQLDAKGFPPIGLRPVLRRLPPEVRHADPTVEWFLRGELGVDGETPVQLLHRGRAYDVRLVHMAAALKWPAVDADDWLV